jgi:hypothetical protein
MKIQKYNEKIVKTNLDTIREHLYTIFNNYCKIGFGNIILSERNNRSIYDIILQVKFVDNICSSNYDDYKEFLDFLMSHRIKFNIKNETLICFFIDINLFISDVYAIEKAKKYNIL